MFGYGYNMTIRIDTNNEIRKSCCFFNLDSIPIYLSLRVEILIFNYFQLLLLGVRDRPN